MQPVFSESEFVHLCFWQNSAIMPTYALNRPEYKLISNGPNITKLVLQKSTRH